MPRKREALIDAIEREHKPREGPCMSLEWSGRFTPNGVSDQEASKLFQGIYEDGLKALAAGFAGPSAAT